MVVRGRVLTPTVGLTVEEVDRITADSRRCTPAAAARSSTSSAGGGSSPDLVNRTDFTRDDLELVARPPASDDDDDDDDTQDETFTCSEYDQGGHHRAAAPPPRLDFANPYRLRLAPSLALPPPPPPLQRVPADRRSSSSGSTVDEMFSVDRAPTGAPAAHVDLGRAATELGWTPDFDVLAAVFLDLAALSDAGRVTSLAAGRSPLATPTRSTPQPAGGRRHRPGVGSDSSSSQAARSPTNHIDVQRPRPLQRLASPAERPPSATNNDRALTPSSQPARRTPLDGVQRRNPPTSTSPPAYEGRRLDRTSSPRDGVATPAAADASRQRNTTPSSPFYSNAGRPAAAASPRGTPRPVLEEYV